MNVDRRFYGELSRTISILNFSPATVSMGFLVGVTLLLTGCAGGPPRVEETVLKISYYQSILSPKTKKPEPVYRVVMSESWRDTIGKTPREPFPKGAGRAIFVGYLPDRDMQIYVGYLLKAGIDKLTSREPESFDPRELYRLATTGSPAGQDHSRVITVGSDADVHRSYWVKDQLPGEQSAIFLKCERFVSQVVGASFNVQSGAEPFIPGRR